MQRVLILFVLMFTILFIENDHYQFINQAEANRTILRLVTDRNGVATARVRPGTTLTVETDKDFSDIVVGNQEVADIVPLTERSLYIQGKSIGLTNITLFDEQKKLLGVIEVYVAVDERAVESAIQASVPSSRITVKNVGNRLRLNGHVIHPPDLPKVVEVAQQFSQEPIIKAIAVGAPQQVSIEVRVLEASRTVDRNLGVNILSATANSSIVTGDRVSQSVDGGAFSQFVTDGQGLVSAGLGQALPFSSILANLLSTTNANVDILIEALEEKDVVRSLAQPNLTALSGEVARFHAGGEIPITSAVSTGGGTAENVDFRPFGVRLEFVPTVLEHGKINLRILSEVSEIDPTITVLGIPGFTSRRAETVVELRDGQSFTLAGLLKASNSRVLQQFPWVGQVPILGSLFRSAAFRKNESDLVIIATPRLVRPAAPDERLASPLDQTRSSNDVELFGLGLLEVDKDMLRKFKDGDGIIGPYGHIIDLEFNDEFTGKK